MSDTYFVADDASGDTYVWLEQEGAEHRPEPIVWQRQLNDYLWQLLTEGMERR